MEWIHWESVAKDDDLHRAVRHVRKRERPTVALYRGWMLSVDAYRKLHAALVERNVWLLNDPDQYAACHLFTGWYGAAESKTPSSVWVDGPDVDGAMRLASAMRGPSIVRDFVKSRKREWGDACFIESPEDAGRVIRNFVERQGDSLVGGIVIREFVKLRHLGQHPKSGMPLSFEYRTFWLDGDPVLTVPSWPEADYQDEALPVSGPAGQAEASLRVPVEQFRPVAALIDSRLFTMDLALTDAGSWIVIELGDGQVSACPDLDSARKLYEAMARG